MFENVKLPENLKPSDPRFACGPSLIPEDFLHALAKTGKELLGTSHRKSTVINLVKEVQAGYRKYFNVPADYKVVFGNGGATYFFDMLALGLVEKQSTHFICGEFSEKWMLSHKKVPWIKAKSVAVPFGQGVTPTDDPESDTLCMTLNETSTGVQIDKLPTADRTQRLVCVDATSGAGQVPCDVSQTDVFFFSPQKVFASEGGLWVAFMSPAAVERSMKIAKDNTRYKPDSFSFPLALDNADKGQTYTTPAVTNFFFMNEQLKLMNKLGQEAVIALARKKADLLYGWAEKKPYLSCYIKEEKYRSLSVATIDMDDKFKADDVINLLRAQKFAYDIDGYRKLGRNQFRIALFHNIAYQDLEKLTQVISHIVES